MIYHLFFSAINQRKSSLKVETHLSQATQTKFSLSLSFIKVQSPYPQMAPGNSNSSTATNNINGTPRSANPRAPEVVDATLRSLSGEDLTNEGEVESNTTTTTTTMGAAVGGGTNTPVGVATVLGGGSTIPMEVAVVGGGSATTPVGGGSAVEVAAILGGGSSSGNGGEGGGGSGNYDGVGPVRMRKCIGGSNREMLLSTVLDQGGRRYMEDEMVTIENFMSMPCNQFGGCTSPNCHYAAENSRIHYFGVFDGHGGKQVSAYCARTLHEIITQEWRNESNVDEWGLKWQIALSRAYERIDDVCKDSLFASAGSTAVVVLLSACQIIAANCGDSRAVLVRKTETVSLTNDHKPNRVDEEERIVKDGGCILDVNGVLRVGGVLTMTRAIGDRYLKPWVSSVPEITFTTRSEEDECLIIASDGVWDVMTTNEVGVLARPLIRQIRRATLSGVRSSLSIANIICAKARSRRSEDNISVIVVDMKPLRRWRPVQP